VGRLIAETLRHFPNKDQFQFVLFSHLPIHESHKTILELPNIEFHQGFGKGAIYYNLILPFQIYKYRLDLFWGSQQVIPPLFQKIPVVLTYCDLVLYKYPESMRFLARMQQRLVQKYSVNRSKFIINISAQTRDDLIEKFQLPKEKTFVAYPGIDKKEIAELGKLKSTLQIDFPYLLSVSTLEPRKNYPFLLSVWKEYRKIKSNPNMKWIIVGKKGWESEEFFSDLQRQINLGDIILLDNVNDIDLHYLYKKANVFLFASHYEGFGIPLLEALSHKTKCLVADIATFKEIGRREIQYLPTTDPKLWADTILEIEQNSIRPSIDLDSFSWAKSAEITKDVFLKAINNE
jgi:glycosyltransferase involved in cell wall biosynthesis